MLDSLQIFGFDRVLVVNVAGVARAGRLKQQDTRLLSRHGPMLDASRHNAILQGPQRHNPMPKVKLDSTIENKKELILIRVMVPDVLTLKLHHLDELSIQFADHLWHPILTKRCEFFLKVSDLNVHGTP